MVALRITGITEGQFLMMGRITALKNIGFSLADIVRLYEDRNQLEQFFYQAKRIGGSISGFGEQTDASGCSPKKTEKGRNHEL